MVVDLKLCRFEDAPWGFRLIGGADFEYPLTVVKVTEGSLADQAGMQVGDVVVRINETAAIDLSHNDAHKVIMNCGNIFFLGILREDQTDKTPENEINGTENGIQIDDQQTPEIADNITEDSIIETTEIHSNDEANLKEDYEETDSTQQEEPNHDNDNVSDEAIAEIISGEAEFLTEHDVIGVNFNRIFPKPGVCQSSEVLRQLNAEAIKTKIEMEKDKRKWTTFLQKPDRPIPKSKKEIEEEANRIPYRVQIIKQPQPKVAPGRIPTPPPDPVPEPEPEIEADQLEELIEETIEPLTDSDLLDLDNDQPLGESAQNENDEVSARSEADNSELIAESDEISPEIVEACKEPQKSEEELALEKQLASVQQQLLALSTLPSTIQATLDAVTKQLADLLPAFRLQPSPKPIRKSVQDIEEEEPEIEQDEKPTEADEQETRAEDIIKENNSTELENSEEDVEEQQDDENPVEETVAEPTPEDIERIRAQREQEILDSELNYKKQKEHELLDSEHQQRLIRERTPKRPPRPFGPLTPQERPLVLPGGRKWRNAKDAFNEELIAEILSSQAELITGSTLGSSYESPLLGYDARLPYGIAYFLAKMYPQKHSESNCTTLAIQLENGGVNFLKYQKPEKKINLEKSEVYKVIHHLEREPRRGIESRPEKVLAEEDVRSRATPISCG